MIKKKKQDPIAIVGYSHRLPGEDRGDFWDLLLRGEDLVTEVAPERWAKESFLHPRKSEPGMAYSFASGSVGDISGFDAHFFGISPREAAQMDPQQRLLLELSWNAFEKGRIRPSLWRGRKCGVYVGISSTDHTYRSIDDLAMVDSTSATGNTMSIASNRLSYFFDLRGPSMSVDTACSSSLVAFHQACQAMNHGEADSAIVAGVSLHLHPLGFINFSKTSMLSKKGRCTPFDADGDGYARSEGAGVVLLKRLSQAIADGDQIFAVVAGTGVNCDGKTSSLTVPSAEAQGALLREVYARAGINPDELSYLEAHGTGTAVGDPIETSALGAVLGSKRRNGPLPIGSVKSNIGHLEAASGMAGLTKALLVLQNRCVPPTIHLKKPNPNIRFEEWGLQVVTETTKLPEKGTLTVGINSFGFGGANAHVILQSPTEFQKSPESLTAPDHSTPLSAPLLLSAKTPAALQATAVRHLEWMKANPEVSLYDQAYAVRVSGEWFPERLAVEGEREEVMRSLQNLIEHGEDDHVYTGELIRNATAPIFVFSGNGSQYAGMGRKLLEESSVFRMAVEEVDALFTQHADFSLIETLQNPACEADLERTEVAQPALFAIQVGLVRMFEDRGVSPGGVMGHSVGEVAAAWACGAMSLEQAVWLIHERSFQQGKTKGLGQMTAVALSQVDVERFLKALPRALRPHLAGTNSPNGVTVAGDPKGLAELESLLAAQGVRFKRLDLDYAFHSPVMDPIKADLLTGLEELKSQKGSIPFYSTVTGKKLNGSKLDASYWWKNVRQPVRFEEAVQSAIIAGASIFVEVGPHPVLRSYLVECLKDADVAGLVATPMTRTHSTANQFEKSFYQLLLAGIPYDEERLFPERPSCRVSLPYYQWQKERFETPHTGEGYLLHLREKEHPLLGCRLKEDRFSWENRLDLSAFPYLKDHQVGGAIVFPAAGFVEMALGAGSICHPSEEIELEDFEIHVPLLLSETHSKTVRLTLEEQSGIFSIKSRDRLSEDRWVSHVSGRLFPSIIDSTVERSVTQDRLENRNTKITGTDLYAMASDVGLEYGEAFRPISSIHLDADGAALVAGLETPACLREKMEGYLLHPTYLDGALQSLVGLLHVGSEKESSRAAARAFLPIRADKLKLLLRGVAVSSAEVNVRKHTRRAILADIILKGGNGMTVARVEGMRFRATQLVIRPSERARFLATTLISKPRPRRRAAEFLTPQDLCKESARTLSEMYHSEMQQRLIGETEPLLEVLCATYAREAIEVITGSVPIWNTDQLLESGALAQVQRSFFCNLVEMLIQDGLLTQQGDGSYRWGDEEQGRRVSSQELWKMLIGDHPDSATLIRAVGRIGMHLPEILSGSISASALLPREWSDGFRFQQPGAYRDLHSSLLSALEGFVKKSPEVIRLRVLWILGNHVRGEEFVAPWMKENLCEMVLTVPTVQAEMDLSARMGPYPAVRVELYNPIADTSPSAEKLGGKFDLIVVGGEMGALVESGCFSKLNDLLLPGGVLSFAEQGPDRVRDFLFGGGNDWWLITESEEAISRLRGWMSWENYLEGVGFVETQFLKRSGNDAGAESGPFIAFARAPLNSPKEKIIVSEEEGSSEGDEWLLAFDGEHSASIALAMVPHLEESHGKCCLQSFAQASDAIWSEERIQQSWVSLLADAGTASRGIIFLLGLGEASDEIMEAQKKLEERIVALNTLLKEATLHCPGIPVTVVTSGSFQQGATAGEITASLEAGLLGFVRVARNEYVGTPIRILDLDPCLSGGESVAEIVSELLNPDQEDEVILREGVRSVSRLTVTDPFASEATSDSDIALDFSQPGSFKNLLWRRSAERKLQPGEVEIKVHASGLNFRDVMYSMGLLPDEALESGFAGQTLGMELSGVVTAVGSEVELFDKGDEVIAFAPSAFASRAVTRQEAVMRKPRGWSFESAATIPTAFFTVYYALEELARAKAGERLLIHGAAGGVGIAAIQIASHFGLEIFATAGSDEKRDFVKLLGADHVLDSRSLLFADEILALTGGAGVDIILNSLAGEAINRNLKILRPFGRFLELGKRDFYENSRVGLRPFRNNISYFGIDADQLMAEQQKLTARIFSKISDLFELGVLKPLPYTAFDASEVAEAFRFMQHSRQIGKVVIRQPITSLLPLAQDPSYVGCKIHADGTYLVTGGTSGFGLQSAEWLVDRGAKSLVLASRRALLDEQGKEAVARMESQGVTVTVAACDITKREDVQGLLDSIREWMPPLKGVIHSAMVIDDSLLQKMSRDQLTRVMSPKVLGALLLDQLTRQDPLDLFVLYSSATTSFGNPGQGAYVAANMVMESLSARRKAEGLPSTCVAWGPIGDAGYLARNEQIREALCSRMGGMPLRSGEALAVLDSLAAHGIANTAWLDLDWGRLSRFLHSAAAPRFALLRHLGGEDSSSGVEGSNLRDEFSQLDQEELLTAVTDHLKHEISKILRIEAAKLDVKKSLFEMGMDSLMGVELVGSLEANLGIHLPILALTEGPTISKLSERVTAMLNTDNPEEPQQVGDLTNVEEQVRLLASQHGASEISQEELTEIVHAAAAEASR
jgi:acyl transferase domain-containing protein/NADPH:quinone reductase-like Zn-dependent oxidoreductase/acyl carrier protein